MTKDELQKLLFQFIIDNDLTVEDLFIDDLGYFANVHFQVKLEETS